MVETGILPALVLGGMALLKEVGIIATAVVVTDWLLEDDAPPDYTSGWAADVQRSMWADRYSVLVAGYLPELTGTGLASLTASAKLAEKAILEHDSDPWEGGLLYRALHDKAARLLALQAAGGIAGVELLPPVSMTGAGMVIGAAGSTPGPPVASASFGAGGALLGLAALVGAAWWWWSR